MIASATAAVREISPEDAPEGSSQSPDPSS
jgi:hypothetical protein